MHGPDLSDTQLLILSAAAQRDDLRIILPDRLHGGAGQKVLAALLGKALIEEIPESELQRVAFDPGAAEQLTYRISPHGLVTIGVESEDQEPATATGAGDTDEVGPGQGVLETGAPVPPTAGEGNQLAAEPPNSGLQSTSPRAGSKLADLIELLARPDGASINELTVATGWLPHTTRAALTGLRKRGISVERDKRGDGTTIYRNAPPATVVAESEAV